MEVLTDSWNKYILPNIPDNAQQTIEKHRLPISASIVLLGLYLGLNELSKPPKNLRHLPQASFWKYLKGVITSKPTDEVCRDITLPAAHKSEQGLFTMFDKNGGWVVHITQPEAAKKLLNRTNIFAKAGRPPYLKGTLAYQYIFGPNVAFLDGSAWKHQRMIANPAFHRATPIDLFGDFTVKLFKALDSQENTVNFHNMMERCTLDIIGKAGFGFDFNALESGNSSWVKLYHDVTDAVQKPLFLFFPIFDTKLRFLIPGREKKHQQLSEFFDLLGTIINHKREAFKEKNASNVKDREKDLLTLMMEAGSEDGEPLTDEELKSNLCIFFIAGHDTTANALSFAAYHLAVNQDIQQKAREEAIRVLGDEPYDVLPTQEQLQQLTYTTMVIKEALRINGPVSNLVVRQATEDTDLSGVFIPKGTGVNINIYAMHHNPKVWKDPEVFDPERFSPGGEAERAGLSWLPFGSGARNCIGTNFSMAEQRVMLPMLLRKYELSLPKDTIHKDKIKLKSNDIFIITPDQLYLDLKSRY